MKKKLIAVGLVVILALSLTLIPFTLAGADEYDSSLILENKNTDTWEIISADGISGLLEYNASGTSFDFRLTASGLANGDYSLIYYTDTENRFVDWGGADGIVIATFAVTAGSIDATESVFLGTGMPINTDANGYFYDYSEAPDFYEHGKGAKIWLVPTSALTSGDMPVATWSPDDNWLFETDLIEFEQLVSNPVGFDGDVVNPMLMLSVGELPSTWYNTATYVITIDVNNDTDASLDGVYGKLIGWDTSMFGITYMGKDLNTDADCGYWAGDVYYFAPVGGDTYAPHTSKSFDFSVTCKKAGAFDIGIVLVAGVADTRDD